MLAEVLTASAANPLYAGSTAPLSNPLTSAQATALANDLVAFTTNPANGSLRSRSELVTTATMANTYGNGVVSPETILSGDPNAFPVGSSSSTTKNAKIQREAAIRTLSEAGNARTWNLLIDIIAQSGRYAPNLPPGSSLSKFIPNGERRYWLHIAIDRYTGRVVDRFLEPVQE